MHAPSTLEENQWPNLEAVEREIADVRRRQLLLQDKLRRQRSLWGAVGNRVRAVVGGTNHHVSDCGHLDRVCCCTSQALLFI